jgi:alpha-beta hydrolase superfamily lysophospholipase
MKTNEFSWLDYSGMNIFALEWAPETETRAALGLIHGLGEHIGRYHHVARRLTEAGYALVGFDMPGHGKSDGPRGFTSYAEISQEMDHLLVEIGKRYPGKPAFLYGHSMGGVLVLEYVMKGRHNLRGAIVTAPGLAPGQPVPVWKQLVAKGLAGVMPSFSVSNGLDRDKLSRDRAVVQAYQDDPLVHDRASARLGRDILTRGNWTLAHAQEFPLPLLLMQGSADQIASTAATKRLAAIVPADRLTYQVWEGLYHEIHNEPEQEQVFEAMRNWLDQHTEVVY